MYEYIILYYGIPIRFSCPVFFLFVFLFMLRRKTIEYNKWSIIIKYISVYTVMIIELKKHLPLMQYINRHLRNIIRRYVPLYLLCRQNKSFDDNDYTTHSRSSSFVNIPNSAFNTYTILYCDARVRVKYFPFH